MFTLCLLCQISYQQIGSQALWGFLLPHSPEVPCGVPPARLNHKSWHLSNTVSSLLTPKQSPPTPKPPNSAWKAHYCKSAVWLGSIINIFSLFHI